jgi:hypothetical protein
MRRSRTSRWPGWLALAVAGGSLIAMAAADADPAPPRRGEPAAIVLDAGTIVDSPKPVDAKP